ncbi:CvpA family protein [Roseimaritima ulvae]|uniref:CvpA family protein n=1 Tax=Roseimaritima ulvae TaxID=980254 RepID=UPI001FD26D84|nr:CvpA family protein [Roseimaritima ulvae]
MAFDLSIRCAALVGSTAGPIPGAVGVETYDILMLVVLAGAAIFGAIKGFAWQLASIGSIVLSYVVAVRYREPFSQAIAADPPWNRLLAMLILYVGTSLVIWVAFRMISKTIDRMKLREFDRHAGAAFGLGKGILYCTLITLFAATLLGPAASEKIVQSRSGYYIAKLLARGNGVMPTEVQQVIGPYIERFDADKADK